MILWCRQHAWLVDVGGPEVTNGPAEVFRPEAGGTPSERWGVAQDLSFMNAEGNDDLQLLEVATFNCQNSMHLILRDSIADRPHDNNECLSESRLSFTTEGGGGQTTRFPL